MKFVLINCWRLILICQFVLQKISGISGTPDKCDSLVPPHRVRIVLMISLKSRVHINLKLSNRVLANEHLPVWVMEGKVYGKCGEENGGPALKLKDEVMQQLGKFSFYQDPGTSSAAVYFYKRRQFDGMIDHRYLIQRLPIEKIRGKAKSLIKLGEPGIILRPQSVEHPSQIPDMSSDVPPKEEYKIIATYKNRLYDGYPEILIVVSYGLVQKLVGKLENTHDYTPIVSYILELFNGVDMFYSKLKTINIELNIAGVIIASESESIILLKDCYVQRQTESENHLEMLKPHCAIEQLEKYLGERRDEIPSDSYDAVVYLTTHELFNEVDGMIEPLEGISAWVPVYKTKKRRKISLLIATVHDDGSFKKYPATAHELAHLMNVDHDEGPMESGGKCCGHIMKIEGGWWCRQCLSWSDESEEDFKTFYSSADCCGFINFPQSLFSRGIREKITADEQCQCYGFKSSRSPGKYGENYCSSKLKCHDDNGDVHRTVFPMDGTKCGIDKVCWNRKCQSITDTYSERMSHNLW